MINLGNKGTFQSNCSIYLQFTALNLARPYVGDERVFFFFNGSLCIAVVCWGLDMTG